MADARRIEAVIYDMDGVLVDSEVYWLKARVDFAAALGKTWTDDDQRAAMGRSTVEWAAVMRERLALDMTLETIMAEVIARVRAQYDARMPARPGALESVAALAATRRFRLGLASGSPTAVIDHVLALTGLRGYFEVVVYGDDMRHGKPAPDIYLEAMRQLGVSDPARAVGIEDSGNGLRALRAAGMKSVAAPSPAFPLSPDLLALADRHITSLEAFTVALVDGLA
jgi:HAD superfamily hydrolase (TIGR01509 family)